MTPRQRFNAIMDFAPADRGLFTPYWGVWPTAWERWKAEGLGERHWAELFDFDVTGDHLAQFTFVGVNKFVYPAFDVEILDDQPGRQLVRDKFGVTKYMRTDGVHMVQFVSYPVTDQASWESFKTRLDPETPGRLPENLATLAAREKQRDYVLGIGGTPMGLFSGIREFMGPEAAMIACALEPAWVRAMAEHLADLWIALYAKVLNGIRPDFLFLWELICDNKGPMISPRMFRDLFLPSYKRLIAAMKDLGVRNIWIDCQGRAWDMMPLFIEAGVTGNLPVEVRAGMDVGELRRRYPRLQLIGGIERMALVRGPAAIDAELERVGPFVARGGYLPTIDHTYSDDIPWEHFRYFVQGLRRITSTPIRPD